MSVRVTVVSWNLRGRDRPDLAAVAAHLAAREPDVVALQEVQRHQARALARLLRWPPARWSFKHFPVVTWPEGMAVLAPAGVGAVDTVVLSRGAPPWRHTRRIAQLAVLADGLVLANVHLASGADETARRAQATRLVDVLPAGAVVAGDLNARPGSDALAVLRAAGWRDTCHDTGRRARHIDHVLVPGDVGRVLAVDLPDRTAFRALSDHAPLTVTVDTSQTAATP